MKSIIGLVLIMILAFSTLNAQQEPLYANYINNPLVINPAYAGINNVLNASASYRKQWAGFEGSPNTTSFSAHSSFVENKVGGGILLATDKIGNVSNTYFNAVGSYKIDLGEAVFSFGLQAGVLAYNEDNSELNQRDPDALFDSSEKFSKLNIGAGGALKGENFFIGISVPRLINNTEEIQGLETDIYNRHFYLTAGYVFELNSDFSLRTSALLKTVSEAPASVDLNASLLFLDKYAAGLLTRNFETYGLIAQMNVNHNFRFGYIFEVPTNKSVGTRYTSHEITLMLDLEVFDFHFLNERYF